MDGTPRKAFAFKPAASNRGFAEEITSAPTMERQPNWRGSGSGGSVPPAFAVPPRAAPGDGRTAGPGKVASLHLLGPVRLIDAQGVDRTPKGGMRAALLAVLALSQHGTKARVKLQDLLWGARDQAQGSQSLRTAICLLRRDLATLPAGLIEADKQVVRLDVARLRIDVLEYVRPENHARLLLDHGAELPDLLEGLNVRASEDEAFEDWLREERRHWSDTLEDILDQERERDRTLVSDPQAVASPAHAANGRMLPFGEATGFAACGVGLMPSIMCLKSQQAAFLGDLVVDCIATGLRDFALAEIYDYRDNGPLPEDCGPRILLQAKIFEDQDRLMLTLLAYDPSRRRQLWNWTVEFPCRYDLSLDSQAVSAFVNQAVERICDSMRQLSQDRAEITPFHALNLMFRLDAGPLDSARDLLARGREASGDPVYLSLIAYLNSFQVGEHYRVFDQGTLDETRDLVHTVVAENPFNSLALALTGHTFGYILHDYETGGELLARSVELNPNLAVCWDHLALNHLYCGRLDKAESAVQTALRVGAASPLRFTFETTKCMIATLRGDYATAVGFGERALARQPKFGAALRYMAVSFGHLGNFEAARRIVSQIRSMDHGFSSEYGKFAVADEGGRNRLSLGLQKAGA